MARCPLQVPVLVDRTWMDAHDEDESSESAAAEGEEEPDWDDEEEPDDREQQETVRLEIRISDDGTTAEVVLLEGEADGWLEKKPGSYSLVDD